jgi:hypothetical protein
MPHRLPSGTAAARRRPPCGWRPRRRPASEGPPARWPSRRVRRPARNVAVPAPADLAGTAGRPTRRPAPPSAPAGSPGRRTRRARRWRRRRSGRTGRTRHRRCQRFRSGRARPERAGTTARGRPGSGPAHQPRPAARRRTGGSSPTPGTWSARPARRRAGCARPAGPARRRSRHVRGRLPRRRGPLRPRTTRRTRPPCAAAPDHRTRAGHSSSRWRHAARRGGRLPAGRRSGAGAADPGRIPARRGRAPRTGPRPVRWPAPCHPAPGTRRPHVRGPAAWGPPSRRSPGRRTGRLHRRRRR